MHDISIWQMITQSSLVVQLVLILLLAGSISSWTIIFNRARILRKLKDAAQDFKDQFYSGQDAALLRKRCDCNLAQVLDCALLRLEQLDKTSLNNNERLESAESRMQVCIEQQTMALEKNLNWLATIGSISPYVGLFGTVWGILSSFQSLGSLGQATLNQVAPGIAEALVATAFGLLVAIPAVIAYNKFSRAISELHNDSEHFAADLIAALKQQLYSTTAKPESCSVDA